PALQIAIAALFNVLPVIDTGPFIVSPPLALTVPDPLSAPDVPAPFHVIGPLTLMLSLPASVPPTTLSIVGVSNSPELKLTVPWLTVSVVPMLTTFAVGVKFTATKFGPTVVTPLTL